MLSRIRVAGPGLLCPEGPGATPLDLSPGWRSAPYPVGLDRIRRRGRVHPTNAVLVRRLPGGLRQAGAGRGGVGCRPAEPSILAPAALDGKRGRLCATCFLGLGLIEWSHRGGHRPQTAWGDLGARGPIGPDPRSR